MVDSGSQKVKRDCEKYYSISNILFIISYLLIKSYSDPKWAGANAMGRRPIIDGHFMVASTIFFYAVLKNQGGKLLLNSLSY